MTMLLRASAIALVLGLVAPAAGAAQVTAFVDVNVLPMDRDTVLTHHTVIVTGDRISALGTVASTVVPAGARRIDGGGRVFLIPGLIDAHVHLELGERRWISIFLAYGVTTVFNLRGDPRHLAL